MSLSPVVVDHDLSATEAPSGAPASGAPASGALSSGLPASGPLASGLPSSGLPEPEGILESLTLTVLEVLAGVRDLDQMARWVSDDVYRNLMQRVVLSARARQVKGERLIRPTFTIGRTMHSEPTPGVIEGVVIVHGKARSRAVALRLERLESRWRASAINVL